MSEVLSAPPSSLSLFLGSARTLGRKPARKPQLPSLSVQLNGVRANGARLAAYNAVCGYADSEFLPITYPQIMVWSLQMHLLAKPEFPLPMPGLVHLRNHTEQTRRLRSDETFDVLSRVGESREVRAGLEFDLVTEFTSDGAVVSRSVMTTLYRIPAPKGHARPAPPPAPQLAEYRSFDVPADQGRRYAKVSGDYNPIHLYPLTAKLFGFPRAIAHGMWSLARIASSLEADLGRPPSVLEVQFKQPLLLPGKVALKFQRNGTAIDFALLARNSDKVHLAGSLR